MGKEGYKHFGLAYWLAMAVMCLLVLSPLSLGCYSVFSSICPKTLGACSKQVISEREKEVCCSSQSSTHNEKLNLVKEETPFLKHMNA
jgi:hypothetical protein